METQPSYIAVLAGSSPATWMWPSAASFDAESTFSCALQL